MAGWGNNNGRTNFCAARRTSAGHERDEGEREAEREEEDEEEARFHDTAREEEGRIPEAPWEQRERMSTEGFESADAEREERYNKDTRRAQLGQ